MHICHSEDKSVDRIIYVIRPTVNEMIFSNFINEFKATPNSEYERLVKRIAKLLLYCGENLSYIYENFYSDEYDSFGSFLEIELDLESEKVKTILENCTNNQCLWRIDVADYETYNFITLFDGQTWEEESLLEKVNMAMLRCEI